MNYSKGIENSLRRSLFLHETRQSFLSNFSHIFFTLDTNTRLNSYQNNDDISNEYFLLTVASKNPLIFRQVLSTAMFLTRTWRPAIPGTDDIFTKKKSNSKLLILFFDFEVSTHARLFVIF